VVESPYTVPNTWRVLGVVEKIAFSNLISDNKVVAMHDADLSHDTLTRILFQGSWGELGR